MKDLPQPEIPGRPEFINRLWGFSGQPAGILPIALKDSDLASQIISHVNGFFHFLRPGTIPDFSQLNTGSCQLVIQIPIRQPWKCQDHGIRFNHCFISIRSLTNDAVIGDFSDSRLGQAVDTRFSQKFVDNCKSLKRIELLPQSRYRDFACTDEGLQGIRVWIEKIIQAIAGQPEVFLSDAEEVGYMRSHQGYKLGFIFNFYRIFKQIVWELIEPEIHDTSEGDIAREFHEMNDKSGL